MKFFERFKQLNRMSFFNKNLGKSQRYTAFTLAEVLIVLGIIGIIAELTIPDLVSNVQKQEVAAELKSTYTNLFQAVKLSEIDNGDVSSWTWPTPSDGNSTLDWFNTYLAKYYKYNSATVNGAWVIVPLVNGVTLEFWCHDYDRMHVFAYIHGTNKTVYGKDIFVFFIGGTPTVNNISELRPYDYNLNSANFSRDYLKTATDYGCNKTSINAIYCAELIMTDGWEISKDYPYFN